MERKMSLDSLSLSGKYDLFTSAHAAQERDVPRPQRPRVRATSGSRTGIYEFSRKSGTFLRCSSEFPATIGRKLDSNIFRKVFPVWTYSSVCQITRECSSRLCVFTTAEIVPRWHTLRVAGGRKSGRGLVSSNSSKHGRQG